MESILTRLHELQFVALKKKIDFDIYLEHLTDVTKVSVRLSRITLGDIRENRLLDTEFTNKLTEKEKEKRLRIITKFISDIDN